MSVYIRMCDSLALNYNVDAVFDDGSCEFDFVYGCIDTLACNLADTLDVDDGSCTYPVAGFDCDGLCLEEGNVVETFTVNANRMGIMAQLIMLLIQMVILL